MDSLLKSKPNLFREFSAVTTKAAYFNLHQVIELSDINPSLFKSATSGDSSREQLDVLPLLMHEVRHWWDHVSTVWGQQRMVRCYPFKTQWRGAGILEDSKILQIIECRSFF